MSAVRHPHHQLVAFVGGPGAGKSTLAQAVNVRLKLDRHDSEFSGEYARAYLRRSGPMRHPMEQFVVFAGSCQREDELAVHQFVVADSSSALACVYYQFMRRRDHTLAGDAEQDLKMETGYDELRRLCRKRLRRIDHLFVVPPGGFAAGEDPTRLYVSEQEVLHRRIVAYLDDNDAPYHTVAATGLDERVAEVLATLEGHGAFDLEDELAPGPLSDSAAVDELNERRLRRGGSHPRPAA